MAIPGPVLLTKLTAGVGVLVAFYTQDTPEDSDHLEVENRKVGDVTWASETTQDENDHAITGLEPETEYEVRVRGVSIVDGPGPWSNILSEFTAGKRPDAPDFKRIYQHLLPRGGVFKK